MNKDKPVSKRLKIAIVVGEVSGDTLGAALIRSFKAQGIDAEFEGIGGSQMIAEGFHSLYPMESLSVMGLVEVLKHLKSLFAIRDGLIAHWTQSPPDMYIGIDAPDFNLRVAKLIKDKQLPIRTVQYVSPSVWAWRQKRVFNIKYAIDLVLCLFPFEVDFYHKYDVPAVFVGHPLARQLPLHSEQQQAKQQLNLPLEQGYIALLPGSRSGEVARLLPVMLEAVQSILQSHSQLQFVIPAINPQRAAQIREMLATQSPQVQHQVRMIENYDKEANIGRLVMQGSDAIVLASGTATLEALLLHRPMVVVYKLHWLTYFIASLMVKIPYYSLPNIIAKNKLVSELIQSDATADNIEKELLNLLNTERGQQQTEQLLALHQMLIADQSIQDPAQAILKQFQL
jgi:lipid-A-disaccharide synthase